MGAGKKLLRRKFPANSQRWIVALTLAAGLLSMWFYSRRVRTSHADQLEVADDFEDYVANRKSAEVGPDIEHGLLDVFGLKKRPAKTEAWRTLEELAKAKPMYDPLLSAAMFEANGRFQFTNLEPLARHIWQTLNDYQRFLQSNLVRLHRLTKRFPDIIERRAIEERLITLAGHSREFNRILRKEMKDFLVRTGLAKKSREALYKLKLKLQTAIQQRQAQPCRKAVKCSLANPNGFASGIHDVLWCLIKGFQDHRRVVLDSRGWHYLGGNVSWTDLFRRIDDGDVDQKEEDCANLEDSDLPGPNGPARASIHDVPIDIAETLVRHHSDPYAWYFGQFIGHIMRPSSLTEELLHQAKQLLGFKSPIVGLHVRRTDKLAEAAFHEIEEYMEHVEEYYQALEANVPKRVFVATDEPRVLDDLREAFPDFVFISNVKSAELANHLETRDEPASLQGLIIDLFLMAQTDKLVCTLSSGVCRIAYELMQARRTDATDQLVSLDTAYFYAYVAAPPVKAIYDHRPVEKGGLYLSTGDCVGKISDTSVVDESVKKPNYDGFSVGILCGSNLLAGSYPTYKAVPTVRLNGTRVSLF